MGEAIHGVYAPEVLDHLPGAAVADEARPLSQLVVIGEDAAPHVRAHGLFRVEGKASGRRQGTCVSAFVPAEDRLAGVLVDHQPVACGDLVDGVHVADQAAQMHDENRPGAIGDTRLDGLGAYVDRAGCGIGEHGDVTGADQALHGAEVADRTHDDLVAGFEVEGRGQHGQGRRTSRRGDAVGDAVGLGEGALEPAHHVAGEPGVDDLGQVLHGARAHLPGKGLGQRSVGLFLGCGPEARVLARSAVGTGTGCHAASIRVLRLSQRKAL